jgi:hypothetical protein
MSQPVKLSDSLVLDARLAADTVQRSIAGQVEFWSRLASVDTAAGHARLDAYLKQQPFPHYQPHPTQPGLLERIDSDGTRTTGRFVNRQFQAVRSRTAARTVRVATRTAAR